LIKFSAKRRKIFFRLPALVFSLPTLPYVTVAHPAHRSSGIATVGHGWACAHPTSARVGREICTNSKFFGGVGWGSRLRMSLKVHRICAMNTSRKCICPLQMYMHIWLLGLQTPTGALPLDPTGGLLWGGHRGFGNRSPPNPLCPPYLQTLATSLHRTRSTLVPT